MVSEMTEVTDTKGICQNIGKTQLFAKFLGLLVFGPNWNLGQGSDLSNTNEYDAVKAIGDNSPPIELKDCILASWQQYRLIIVIPWVVQFLGMIKW